MDARRYELLQKIKVEIERVLKERKEKERAASWEEIARPNQIPPSEPWNTWLILAGRGFGKTRTGAETIRQYVDAGTYKRIALVGRSQNEARDVMVEGESGLLAVSHTHPPRFERGKGRLVWPNGAVAHLFGAENYEKLRGPQFDCAWVDELAKFRRPQPFWDQLQMCLRLGEHPRTIITTTPRPIPLIHDLMKTPHVALTRGSTFENTQNLAPGFIAQMHSTYDGTALGAQELYGEILSEQRGALWTRKDILYGTPPSNTWERMVIAIDPATTHHENSDETGIVLMGIHEDGYVYVLSDLSGRYSPNTWGQLVVDTYHARQVDRIIAEGNKGGDLVKRLLFSLSPHLAYREVHATRGKFTRAEPVAALYEQKKIFHTQHFHALEDQMCNYVPGISTKSPDRMDALVWGITDLLLEREASCVPKVWRDI